MTDQIYLIIGVLASVAIFVAAIILLVQNWSVMPTWAIVIGLICLIVPVPFGAIICLLLALFARK